MIPKLILTVVLAALAICNSPIVAFAQVPGRTNKRANFLTPAFPPPNRTVMRMLDLAQKLIDQGRHGDAVKMLNSVLNPSNAAAGDEDYFFRDPGPADEGGGRRYRSLRGEARRLLGELPKAAREIYELRYGIVAQETLDDAIATGDIELLSEVQRRYFHTRAGHQAMVLLGRYHLDHGRPMMAALCFKDVHRSPAANSFEPVLSMLLATCWNQVGEVERAAAVLIAIKQKHPRAEFEIGGRPVRLFEQDDKAIAWLNDTAGKPPELPKLKAGNWVMFRGNAARTAPGMETSPLLLRPRWRQRVAIGVDAEEAIANRRAEYTDRSVAALPALQPLAFNDIVVMRGPNRLAAVDVKSGKLIWHAEGTKAARTTGGPTRRGASGVSPHQALMQRVWLDSTFGSMSSDGDLLFTVESGTRQVHISPQGRRRLYSGPTYNVLSARSVSGQQGNLVWSIGGPNSDDPELEEAFFLGPPLPRQGQLYLLVEINGEVRLLVLKSRTGKQLWSQQLAVVPQSSLNTSRRHLAGISPSFADGHLICPTGVGAVVAVDLTTRHLSWGYQYPQSANELPLRRGWGVQTLVQPPKVEEMWSDACAIVSGGRLLITPTESDFLHCLKVHDGAVEWRVKRDGYLHVACIYQDRAIVVGPDKLTAIDMRTGKTVKGWPFKLPTGSLTSGRGYDADGRYYLPLSTPTGGEVVCVDLNIAKIVSRSKSRNGTIPGNLICHRGQVLSQNSDWLQSFYQLEPLKDQIADALRKSPNDPLAILRRGEILVDEDRSAEAINQFRTARDLFSARARNETASRDQRSDAIAYVVHARQLLFEALLDGLKTDFVAQESSIPEIEQLIQSLSERIGYLRVLAMGQESAGRGTAALETYLKLIDSAADQNPLLSIDNVHSVRLGQWTRWRVKRIFDTLDETARLRFTEEITTRRDRAVDVGTKTALRTFDRYFGSHPVAYAVKRQLVEQLDAGNHLDRVALLEQLEKSPDVGQRRAAVAQLGLLYSGLDLHRQAGWYLRLLKDQWPDDIVWDEKTGDELFDTLPQGSPYRKARQDRDWPSGKATLKQGPVQGARRPISRVAAFPVKLLGDVGAAWKNMSLSVDQQSRFTVFGQDALGNNQWTVQLLKSRDDRLMLSAEAGQNCARTQGALLILSVGNQVLAIDTLKASSQHRSDAILWRQNRVHPIQDMGVNSLGRAVRNRRKFWDDDAPNQMTPVDPPSRLGPITAGGVTFVRNRELVSVDPITGEIVWSRKGIDRDAELIGDEEYLFVVQPEKNEALVFSPIDGQLLARRDYPTISERWSTSGRRVLVWRRRAQNKWQVALYDPWTKEDIWVHAIEPGSKGRLVGDDAVAVLEKNGRFVVLDVATGKRLVEQTLAQDRLLRGIYVIRSPTAYLLVTNRGAAFNEGNKRFQAMPRGQGSAFVSGRIYAFEIQSGDPLWKAPVEIKQQGLILKQPTDLPALVFSRLISDNKNRNVLSFLFIDKRTGQQVVPPKEFANREYVFDVAGNYDKKTMMVFFQNRSSTITLAFTDEPIPAAEQNPGDGENAGDGAEQKSTLEGAIKALRKAASASSGIPDVADDESSDE